ncbi:MAG: MlaD family protein [Elusimicrobiota bacterium]|nr:MlaD family protein [Elusimicrobiota bacterium]
MTKEAKLGLFVLLGTIAFAVSVLSIKGVRVEPGYRLHIYFNEVAGLLDQSWVRLSGVKVGKVKKIDLEGGRAKVTVWLKSKVKVHKDTEAKIVSTGLLGVKYLELTLGSDTEPLLKNGDTIVGIDPVSIDKMLSEGLSSLNELSKALQGLVGEGKFGENLNALVKNAREIVERFNRELTEQKLSKVVDDIEKFAENAKKLTGDISEITGAEKTDIKVALKNLRESSEKLNKLLDDIKTAETTVGKLFSDKEMGEDLKKTVLSLKDASSEAKKTLARFTLFKTYWDYELRHDHKFEEFKSDIGLQIRPKPDKFYYLGVSNAQTADIVSQEKKNTFDLLVGRDFNIAQKNFGSIYAGLIRSSGGLGLSVRPFWKWNLANKLEIYTDFYDFARSTTKGETKVRINTGARISPVKWVKVTAGIEDVAEESSFHTSANLVLEDEDLAYLLALVGLARP